MFALFRIIEPSDKQVINSYYHILGNRKQILESRLFTFISDKWQKKDACRVTHAFLFCDPQNLYANIKYKCGFVLVAISKCSIDSFSRSP